MTTGKIKLALSIGLVIVYMNLSESMVQAAVKVANPYPECPPNSTSVWVRMDDFGQSGEILINVPFEVGYDNADADGAGLDFATENVNYVTGVLWQEIGPLPSYVPRWSNESIRAMAVAARTLAYNWCGVESENDHRIIDDSNKQAYNPHRSDEAMGGAAEKLRYKLIVETTVGIHMTYEGTDFDVQYRDMTGAQTLTGIPAPPHIGVEDPVGANYGPTLKPGMAQINSDHWASGNDPTTDNALHPRWESYQQILTHYYTQIRVVRGVAQERITPEYRWVPLLVNWHTTNNGIPIMEHGTGYPVTFQIQNTGVSTWLGTGQFALIYHGWDVIGTQQHTAQPETYAVFDITEPVLPGAMVEDSITLYPPTPPEPGTAYQLRFEMGLWQTPPDDWIGFSETEVGYTWPTYNVTICVGGPCQEQVFLPLVNREIGTMR